MSKRIKAIQIVVLQLRHFIDESFIFIEKCQELEINEENNPKQTILSSRQFKIKNCDISKIRLYVIQCIRLTFYLKQIINQDFNEYNNKIEFENKFQKERIYFFQIILNRLDSLLDKLKYRQNLNEFVLMYVDLINKIAKCTNQFVDYVELRRWSKNLCLEHLDMLIKLANDFLFVFENVLKYLKINENIVDEMDSLSSMSFGSLDDICENNKLEEKRNERTYLMEIIWSKLIISLLAILVLHFLSFKFSDKKGEISNNHNEVNKKDTVFIERLFKLLFYIETNSKRDKQSKDDIFWHRVFVFLSNWYLLIINFIVYWIFDFIMYYKKKIK
jgi:hypothetical protein